MSFGILCVIVTIKFDEGAWITVLVTGFLVVTALYIRHTYNKLGLKIGKMNFLVNRIEKLGLPVEPDSNPVPHSNDDPTAVMLVSGYNGLGMSALLSLLSYHGRSFHNIVFIQIGLVDNSILNSPENLEKLQEKIQVETGKYAALVKRFGFNSENFWSIGSDMVSEVMKIAPGIHEKYPKAIFFAGQIVMKNNSVVDRILHNYQSFSLQRHLFQEGIPFELLPISLEVEN